MDTAKIPIVMLKAIFFFFHLKNMRKKRPDCAIIQYPYITEQGVSHYGTLSEEMVHYLEQLLLSYLPEEKIFIWNGGI